MTDTPQSADEHDMWHDRWRSERIGFHQPEPNKLLMKHWPSICPDGNATVFVPLCGKSHDMTWLAEQGHAVIGVELSEIAARDYFKERGITAEVRSEGAFEVYSGGGVEIWVGDFFALPPAVLTNVRAAFDRASLIALPEDIRTAYARQMHELMPASARTLLLTITYDPSEMEGPPFSVPDEEVARLYGGLRKVTRLETRDASAGSRNLQDRGATQIMTSVFDIGAAL
jgi:thiopurine S-methyltransferase